MSSERAIANKLSVVGIGGNILLASFKFLAGVLGNSAAMVSDAVHSLSDVLATAIAYLGVRLSKRSADASHPFGHERFECVASLLLGLILAVTGIGIGAASVESIVTGAYLTVAAPSAIALAGAIVSIAVKEAMFWYTRHWAKVLNSSAFMADAWHHRSDAISSIGALIGIAGAMAGFAICDALASIAICLIILKVAWGVLKTAIDGMLDVPCAELTEEEIGKCLTDQAGVVRLDALRSRQFGNRAYVEAEIAVDGELPLHEAHAIAEDAHHAVEKRFPAVKHIMIHVNPA